MNEALRKLIKRFEGFSIIPYTCPAGAKTIGWGHNIDANGLPSGIGAYLVLNGKITLEMAEQLLEDDVSRSLEDIKSLLPDFDKYSENRRNALTDWIFQLGRTKAAMFKITLKMIKDEHWDMAADNLMLSKWYKQSGKRSKEICKMLRDG